MIHVHELDGCAPTPLAHYLKALGILRLVAEQADEHARGWWEGNHFRLATGLTKEYLERFFLRECQPTPFVSPWNKGAGFFSEEDPGIHPLENSTSRRFESFRSGIEASRSRLEQLSKADKSVRDIKAEAKRPGMSKAEKERIRNAEDYRKRLREADKWFKQLKANVIPDLRSNWRGPHREWMDAAMVLGGDGTPKYPALLGSGGNDGRLDFTNNFMQRLGDVFDLGSDDGGPQPAARSWLSGALWSQPVPGNLPGQPVGQYLPGTAGGANNGNGPDAGSMVNPVDFILMLEGTITFTSHASRRFGSSESSRAASPFVVNARGAAYASAATSDESARGEQWMPLWSHPLSYAELRRLLAEGRAQIGSKAAREPLDVARAVKRLGIARGIEAFQRYGYIERNGQSNLAVPLGRFEVSDEHSESLACIDDLDTWLRRLRREARGRHAPARLATADRRLADALFAVTERPRSPEGWQRTLACLAEVERTMRSGSGFGARPVPRLRPEWVTASYDGTAEFRLALAFALQSCAYYRVGGRLVEDQIRRHWLPLERRRPGLPLDPEPRFATTGAGSKTRLEVSPEVVMDGRRGLDDAIALVERRLVEASQHEGRHLPLRAAPHAAAGAADLASLLSGGVDLDRTLILARTLMALDRGAWAKRCVPTGSPHAPDWPDDAWLAIRLCALPWPLRTRSGFEFDVGTDPAIVRRLAAGDAASAVDLALRRLGAAGVRCTVRVATASPATARLWAAALAFPITKRIAERFLYRLDPNLDPNKE